MQVHTRSILSVSVRYSKMFGKIFLCLAILCLLNVNMNMRNAFRCCFTNYNFWIQGSSANSVDNVLEKLLNVVTAASKNEGYRCQSLEKCTCKYPVNKLTRRDLQALRWAFLAERLSVDAVEKITNDVFEKFAGEYSLDETFEASVSFLVQWSDVLSFLYEFHYSWRSWGYPLPEHSSIARIRHSPVFS